MPGYDPNIHHRRSIRLKNWDYRSNGLYFVTIVTFHREMRLGEIVESSANLSDEGKIVEQEWLRSEAIRHEIFMDEYIVMPNHLHGIVAIYNEPHSLPRLTKPLKYAPSQSLGTLVAGFKAAATSRINRLRGNPTRTPIWQTSYYETIIRNDRHLQRVREYIQNNPANWQTDAENIHPELWTDSDDIE